MRKRRGVLFLRREVAPVDRYRLALDDPPIRCPLVIDGLRWFQYMDHEDHRHYGDGRIEPTPNGGSAT